MSYCLTFAINYLHAAEVKVTADIICYHCQILWCWGLIHVNAAQMAYEQRLGVIYHAVFMHREISITTCFILLLLLLLLLLHPFNGPLSGTTRVSQYQKSKTNLDLLEQETVSDSGINW